MHPKRYLILWYVLRKLCTYLALALAPSPNGPNEIPHDPRHLEVQSGASRTISEPMVRLAQIVHLSCTNANNTLNGPNEIPHDPHHLGVPSGASKMIFEPMVRSAQTMHLSCVKISTTSRWTKTSFCLSLITYEYYWVHPK